MSIGEIIFMVAVVAVAILVTALKGKVPAWVGFGLMLLASIVVIVGSAVTSNFKAIPLGVAGVIGTIIAWIAGATSAPATNPDLPDDGTSTRRDDPDTLGGVASHIKLVPWLIIAAVVVGAVAVTFVIPETPVKSNQPAQRRAQVPKSDYLQRAGQAASSNTRAA